MRYPTEFDGIVANEEREHAYNRSKSRALPIRYDAHGYARSIHAQVGGRSLSL